jgi:hypothetical protein
VSDGGQLGATERATLLTDVGLARAGPVVTFDAGTAAGMKYGGARAYDHDGTEVLLRTQEIDGSGRKNDHPAAVRLRAFINSKVLEQLP